MPDVVEILKDQIRKRGLDSTLITGIEAQTKVLTKTELKELKLKIKSLACPECGQQHSHLIGIVIREVKSFVVFTHFKKTPIILCPTYAEKKRKSAMITKLYLVGGEFLWDLSVLHLR